MGVVTEHAGVSPAASQAFFDLCVPVKATPEAAPFDRIRPQLCATEMNPAVGWPKSPPFLGVTLSCLRKRLS